jgi:hypothetical protein
MGTRSAIGYKTPQGTIRAKYSHYDGYPSYTGAMLQEHYQQARKIAQMVELGDQSFLEKEIFPKGAHSFESPEEGCTIFYGRDRGETDVDAREFDNFADFVDYYESCGCEYFYVWDGRNWIVNDHSAKDANGFYVFDFVETKITSTAGAA